MQTWCWLIADKIKNLPVDFYAIQKSIKTDSCLDQHKEKCFWKWSVKCKVPMICGESFGWFFDILHRWRRKRSWQSAGSEQHFASGQLRPKLAARRLSPARDKRRSWQLLSFDPTFSSLIGRWRKSISIFYLIISCSIKLKILCYKYILH